MRSGASATSSPAATAQADEVTVETEDDVTVDRADGTDDATPDPPDDLVVVHDDQAEPADDQADDQADDAVEKAEPADDEVEKAEPADDEVEPVEEADETADDSEAAETPDAAAEETSDEAPEVAAKPEPPRTDDTQPLLLIPPAVPGQKTGQKTGQTTGQKTGQTTDEKTGQKTEHTTEQKAEHKTARKRSAGAPMTVPIALRSQPAEAPPGSGSIWDDDGWGEDPLDTRVSARPGRLGTRALDVDDADWDAESWARAARAAPGQPLPPMQGTAARRDGTPVGSLQIVVPRGRRRAVQAAAAVLVLALAVAAIVVAGGTSRRAATQAQGGLTRAAAAAGAVINTGAPLDLTAMQADLTTLITQNDEAGQHDRGAAWTIARWTTSPRRLGSLDRTARAVGPVADAGRLLSLSLARAYSGHTDPARLQQLATDLAAFAAASERAGIAGIGGNGGPRRMAVAAAALQAIASDQDTQRWAVCPTSARQCERFEVNRGKLVRSGPATATTTTVATANRPGDIQVLGATAGSLHSSGYLSTPALVDLLLRSADPGDAHRPVVQRVGTPAPSG